MSRLDAANLANNLGMIRRVYGDSALARHNYGEALDICRSEGFSELESKVLNNLGNLEREAGRYESAIGLFESSLALKRWLEDRRGISVGLRNLGLVYLDLGDTRRARELLERSLEEARDIGYKQGEMESTFCLGDLERSLGRHERAEGRYLRAIEERRSRWTPWAPSTSCTAHWRTAGGWRDDRPKRFRATSWPWPAWRRSVAA